MSATTLALPAAAPQRSGLVTGVAALAVTVLIWASFFVSLRAGARAQLRPDELALIRFAPAGLGFLPLLISRWRRIAAVPWPLLASILVGSGLPYFLVAGLGMRHAPVADGSTLIPGTLPLCVALLGTLLYRQRPPSSRIPALLLIGAGVLTLMTLNHGQGELGQGYALFLLGSLMWANYTLALRRSGLSPLEGAALISTGSLALLLPWLLLHPPLGLMALPAGQLMLQGLIQGLGVGLVSTLCYAVAISRLGAETAAAAGALTPVLASLLALPLFGEMPGTGSLLGMVLIVAGVIGASRPAPPAR
ncbi:MAG: DMT family transporter [Pseudogulbenkiania sp.]|nr:DMT family transporter [Pseudogulbenkiania sp.]